MGDIAAGAQPQQNGVRMDSSEPRHRLGERLRVGAQDFQVVEGELALLSMLQACLQLQALAPDLGPEIAHRTVELLKVGCCKSSCGCASSSPVDY